MEAIDTEIIAALTTIATSKSIPFCYGCYARAVTGRCTTCGSDDLMRELPGSGVEYGCDWIIRDILNAALTAANTEDAFEESIAGCYPETVQIGWLTYDVVSAIKELGPVSWGLAHSEWLDSEVSDVHLLSFDGGDTHYWRTDVEDFIEAEEPQPKS